MIRIAFAQINVTVGDLKGNKRKIEEGIKKAKQKQADIILFPELAVCGYPPEDLLHKDHFIKDNIKTLKSISSKVRGITAVIGFVDQKKDKLYNAAAIVEAGKIKGVYRKQRLPNYGVFDERRYFEPDDKNPTFTLKGLRYAVNICEDVWEDVAAKQVKAGAKVIFNISSSPYDVGKLDERIKLIKHHAKKNKVHICYCNLVGGQDELVFDGGSMVVDPKGEVCCFGKEFEEDLIVTDLPLGKASKKKKIGPAANNKPASATERVYKALVTGVRDYAAKNNFKKAILGLSGGIDSSLVAAIAVDALGAKNVIGMSMPSRFTSEGTRSDARILASNLGIEFKEIPIEAVFRSYMETLQEEFKNEGLDVTEENLQARIRGNFIMALSNKFGYLVLTTGNKSEVAVGYCTLYGDMSGGFAVIKDVPKTLVYQLCHHINKHHHSIIPDSILTRPPSAELREDQRDQDSLPDYNVLDGILKAYVENHESLAKMTKDRQASLVKKIITLVDHNEYKRRQAPPGIKITPRAFGKDWRLPITNKYKEF